MDRDRIDGAPAVRRCARPGCSAPAAAMLAYDYPGRKVWIEDLGDDNPASHDLCLPHADGLRVPRGWERHDLRRGAGGAPLRLAV